MATTGSIFPVAGAWPWGYVFPIFLLLAVPVFVGLVFSMSTQNSKLLKELPWAGLDDQKLFPRLRACLRAPMMARKAIKDGYDKYSKHGKPFILPSLYRTVVVLPPRDTAWIAAQPEHVLSGNSVLDEGMGLDYLAHGPTAASARDFTVIRTEFTRQHRLLLAEVLDEISTAVDEEFGEDKVEWRHLSAYRVLQTLSYRAMNRIFVGSPQCARRDYRARVEWWSFVYGISLLVMLNLIPAKLRSVSKRFIAIPTKVLEYWATRELRSKVRQRLNNQRNGTGTQQVPNDMMQWIIAVNSKKPDLAELEPANIAGKMLLFNLLATATTANTATRVLFDILGYKDAASLLAELREEAVGVMAKSEQDTTTLSSMTKLDSVIRETLRYNPIGAQRVREVVATGGIDTPDGVHLPRGTFVHVDVSAMQRDVDIFGTGADEYQPMRHLRTNRKEQTDGLSAEPQAMAAQISNDYLSFGLGRHACPGRFVAVNTIKMMLGYLLTHYELKPLQAPAEYLEIGETSIPKESTMIRVRRRTDSELEVTKSDTKVASLRVCGSHQQ